MELTFNDILVILAGLAGIFIYYQANKNFPAKETANLIRDLSVASKKTETLADDIGVEILKLLNEIRMSGVLPSETGDEQGSISPPKPEL